MKTILFAIGHKPTEDAIVKNLPQDEYNVIGIVTYKGSVLKQIEEKRPDIVLLRQNISGSEDILNLTYEIRTQFPSVRVIFLADGTDHSSKVLPALVSWGIYDIISGKTIKLLNIIEIITSPRTLKDMSKYKLVNLPFKQPLDLDQPDEGKKEELRKEKAKDKIFRILPQKKEVNPQKKKLTELVEKEADVLKTEESIEALKAKIKETSETLESLITEEVSLSEKKDQLLNITNEKTTLLKNLSEDVLNLSFQVDELEADISALNEQKIWLEKDLKTNETTRIDLSLAIEGLRQKINEMPELEEKQLELKELEKTYEDEKNKEDLLSQAIEDKKQALVKLSEEILEKERKIGQSDQSIEEKVAILKDLTINKEDEKQELIKESELLSEQIKKTESEIIVLNEKLTTIRNEKKDVEDKQDKLKVELEKEHNQFYVPQPHHSEDNKKTKAVSQYLKKYETVQVFGFMGSKHGIGNSTIALNVAALMAQKNKVLFIEINEKFPISSYLFELMNISSGLEYAVDLALKGKTEEIKEEILISDSKKVPKNLHFLTFSNSYLVKEKDGQVSPFSVQGFLALIEAIVLLKAYEVVIIDFQPDENDISHAALSGQIPMDQLFMTISQDAHSIGCAFYKNERIRYGKAKSKPIYLLNYYNKKASLKVKDIADWLEIEINQLIPIGFYGEVLADCSLNGDFYVHSKLGGDNLAELVSRLE